MGKAGFGADKDFRIEARRLRRETGDLTTRPQGGVAVTELDEKRLLKLAELVAATPEAMETFQYRVAVIAALQSACNGLKACQ